MALCPDRGNCVVVEEAEPNTDQGSEIERLRSEIALYRDAIEHMHQGLCVFDAGGRIALCNSRYADVLQLPPEKVRPGLSARELIELGMTAGYYSEGLTAKQLEQHMWANLQASPTERSTLVRGGRTYAVLPDRTSAGHWVATFEDISARIEAEDALRGSEARLRAILDAMPDCVKIFDESAKLVHINPKGLELLQAPDLESLSRPGYLAVPAEYLDACIDVHRRVIAGEHVVWTYEVIGLEGRRRHVEAHAVPFRLPDGAPAHMCISRDINERKLAEDALRRSEERLRLVQEASGLADFEAGPDGVAHFSTRLLKLMGLPEDGPAELAFEDWVHLVHPDDRDSLRQMERTLSKRDTAYGEFRIIRADTGETRWIAASLKMQRDEAGNVRRAIGAHLDITERKLAEEELRRNEERLRLVHEATGLADFEAGPDGIAKVSERFVEQTGLPPGTTDLPLGAWLKLVHPDDRERLHRTIAKSLESDDAFSCEFRIIRADNGEVRWISSRTKMERNEAGEAIRSIGAHLDITEQKQVEEALRESEERFRLAAEAAGLGVWDYDAVLDRREWSGRMRQIFGVDADAEATLELAQSRIHPADRARFTRRLHGMLEGKCERFADTFRITLPDGRPDRWVALDGWRTRKADSRLRRIILTARDVTDEKTAEERIRWSANHDPLTRLANRSLFQEKLDLAICAAAAEGGTVGLVLFDLDHFKQINDTLGHDAGDMLLKMFAERLRGVVRAQDTVARFGGDEFAIVLPEIEDEQSLIQLTASLQDRLREPYVHEGRLLDCRVSMGASLYPQHGDTPKQLLKNADVALYAAKAAGRAQVSLFEPHMRDALQRRASMVQLARDAIRDDRIVPYYQPKLDLRTGAVTGFEALLRWRTPRGGIGTPASLEAAFEDLEVAAAISDRMIERVIGDMRGWLDKGVAFGNVAINASAAEFRRDTFAERLLDQLREAKIPARFLQLEVTETVFLGRGAEYVHRALALLHARGVTIALDDFGTGYASLRHLKQFPVDKIKIDQSFVHGMASDPGDAAIIHAVINLGRSLGIRVVAEGIETEAQARRLIELGCEYGQGYLFSKAISARRVPALVAAGAAAPVQPAQGPLRLVASTS
jgi:diguanylate cyclase (GGDEF)-like protein/PAS domain S-box-containing protein